MHERLVRLAGLLEGGSLFPEGDRYDGDLMITGPVPSVQQGGAGLHKARSERSMRERFLLGTMTSEAKGLDCWSGQLEKLLNRKEDGARKALVLVLDHQSQSVQ